MPRKKQPIICNLDPQHWQIEDYKQIITLKELQYLVLNHNGWIIFRGKNRKLKYTKVCSDVYEISKMKSE